MSIFFNTVQIGLNKQMAHHARHGIVTVEEINPNDGHRRVAHYSFMADRPADLVSPTSTTIASVFDQLTKMGFFPMMVETLINGKRCVYNNKSTQPMLVQSI